MITIEHQEPPIGSKDWWDAVEAHEAAYVGYPDTQASVLAEAYEQAQAAQREAASGPAGALALAGAYA